MATQKEANLALSFHEDKLLENDNLCYLAVVEIKNEFGESTNEFCLKAGVYDIEKQHSAVESFNANRVDYEPIQFVPKYLSIPVNKRFKAFSEKEIEVVIEETDGFTNNSFTNKERPCRGGNSISNYRYNDAGTLGAAFKIKGKKGVFILSNWHVLSGQIGNINDDILQPGVLDGGKNKANLIARLYWRKLSLIMDAAIGKVENTASSLVGKYTKCFGPLNGLQTAKLNMKVKKCGRTTRLTTGTITSINVSVKVKGNYPNGKFIFKNQIMTTFMSRPGDSGSLLVNQNNNKVVGLVFAGDNKTHTLANHINYILRPNLTIFGKKGIEEFSQGEELLEFESFIN